MELVPDVHAELSLLEVIGPDGRFNKSSGSIITEGVDGQSQLPETDGGIRIKLVESDFGNSCSQHVPDIPPRQDRHWHTNEKEEFYHFNNIKLQYLNLFIN